MNRVKKIIVSIISMIIIILVMSTISTAYYVGQTLSLSQRQYLNSTNIFCMEHAQLTTNSMTYRVVSNVRIVGTKSTDHTGKTIDSLDNARLAYILSQDNGSNKITGPVQNAVWNFGYTWMNNVGQYHAGLYAGFAGSQQGSSTWLDQAAIDYANQINSSEQVTDNTNKENIQVETYERDGKAYMRIGPFNWTFGGTITEINVFDQNSESISEKLYSSFSGTTENFFDVSGIKSGTDFYISIPIESEVTKITKITGNIQMEVKGVNIWFLENNNYYLQNMLVREPFTEMKNIEINFDYDIDTTAHLKIIKVNKDNHEVTLEGVGFYIMNNELNKYVKQNEDGSISYVETREEATEFITDENGEIFIENLLVGTYTAYETNNPNYGYELLPDGQVTQITAGETTEFVIENKQIYVKLSGIVWVDGISGKESYRNDLFQDNDLDDGDILLDGITVRLKDRTTGETIMETITADGGKYLFMDVLIENLQNYYIEFEYDGLTYTNVVPHIDRDNGSKSAENPEVRDEFNKRFNTVEGGQTQDTGITLNENGEKVYDLNYNLDLNNHSSTLINNGQFLITGNTDETGYSIWDNFEYGMEEIKWINQGLYEREQPDLALIKDLENVRVSVNGYQHVYNYSQRFVNQGEYGDGFNVGVKFGDKYGTMSYTRAIYKADYEYINEEDPSRELQVYVTYRIALRNESTNLISRINSIVDYYDSRYTLLKVGTALDENGSITGDELNHTDSTYSDEYAQTIIDTNMELDPQTTSDIYMEFQLSRETVVSILNDGEVLDNVVEINSYSTFDANGSVYAGVDKDSNPANCTPGDKQTYQDDTDQAPGFKLEVADARSLSGKVFLDSTTGELMTGEIRQGSGAYEDGELGIEGVAITLTENTGSGKVYTATTDSNGDFLITDFIPGDYTLMYTWGDETYTVQKYKGTIYDSSRDQTNKQWFKEDVDNRLTDAIDDYELREQIDEEIKHITAYTETTIDKMNSYTPTMGIGVEYESVYTASSGDRYTYEIHNVDFGIVERARQKMELTKRVASLKLTLANGQEINNVTFDEDGNITGQSDHLTYMGPSETSVPANGYVRVEIDNELIQGARLEVGYEIKATNISELDYLSENYYTYGIIEGDIVTITPTAVIDYLDNDWAFEPDDNLDWEIKTLDEIKDIVAEVVYNNENSSINEKIILYTESLKEHNLAPNENAQVMLNVSKLLATSDDISLDNETELVTLDKNGGSEPEEIPGNYIPGTGHTEIDDSTAETIVVTPATGANLGFVIPITIGIILLTGLGVGIFLIKRKALGNKE